MSDATILPPNETRLERAMAHAIVSTAPDLSPVGQLMDPSRCPARLLAWLAWAMSVDEWSDEWSDEAKRETIRRSPAVHRRKGTVAAMRDVIRSAGLGEVDIIERYQPNLLDGSIVLDGSTTLEGPDHWADYRVVVHLPVTIEQAARLRRMLAHTAPARSRLKTIDYVAATYRLDGAVRLDGTYALGFS